MPQSARLSAGGGVQSQFGQCPNKRGTFFVGASLRTFGHVLLDGKKNVPGMPTLDLAEVPDHVIGSCKSGFKTILEKLTFEGPDGVIRSYKEVLSPDWIAFVESCDGGELQKGITQDLCKELSKISKRSAEAVSGVDSFPGSGKTPSGNEITTTNSPRGDQGEEEEKVILTTTGETISTSTNSPSSSSPFHELTTTLTSESDNQLEEETTTIEYSTTESQTTQIGDVSGTKGEIQGGGQTS